MNLVLRLFKNRISKVLASTALVTAFGFNFQSGFGQACTNITFDMGDFTNWQGYLGSCCPISVAPSPITPGRHTIMAQPSTQDPFTVAPFILAPPPGDPFCARLGNSSTGAQAEALSYDFVVSPNSTMLIYDFAVVLQDPGHSPAEQPRFELVVTDLQTNQPVPCTFYSVAAGQGIPGFLPGTSGIVWRPWTRVGVDLTAVGIGNSVRVEARTGDCSQSGHFGYAYLNAECRPLQIQVDYCLGDTVANFIAPDGFTSYQWYDPSNNPVSTSQSYAVTNPGQGGTYTVQVTSVTGCTASLTTVLNPVSVQAAFNQGTSCDGTVGFLDASVGVNGNVNQWQWSFGDGGTDSVQNPSHQYNTYGTYTVQLLAYADGCSKPDTFTTQITTPPVITPAFTSPTNCSTTNVFTDGSTILPIGSITSWSWDFGDGGSSTQQNPTHTFPASGPYNVQLVVTDNNGCVDSITIPTIVAPIPTAAFSAPNDCVYDPIVFTNGSTPYPNTNITGYQWIYDDGSPNGSTQNTQHLYTGPGTYNVSLVVTGTGGCTDTITQAIVVHPKPVNDFTFTSACLGELTNLINTSTIANPDSILAVLWSFNPPLPFVTTYDASLVFPNAGTYQVTLISTTNNGCRDTVVLPINVGARPNVVFNTPNLAGCEDHFVDFNNGSTVPVGIIDSVAWTFGDGGNSTTFDPNYTYQTPGTYPVTLSVYSGGCDSTLTQNAYINVYPLPIADFTQVDNCQSNGIQFTDGSTVASPDNISQYNWVFNGQNVTYTGSSTDQNPLNNPPLPGQYTAILVTTTNHGCKDTATAGYTVFPNPEADFTWELDCFQKTILIDSSNGGTPSYSYSWDLNQDGVSDANVSPYEYVFLTPNPQNVTLTITDANGCTDDTTKLITIKGAPVLGEMLNIMVLGSTFENDKWDFEKFAPGFNECIDYTFSIYNRWGTKVFETTNDKDFPDLTCSNCFQLMTSTGSVVTPGTYYYILQGTSGFNRNGFFEVVSAQ